MWTVAHKKCWTADRLAKKGLSHPAACPLCDQDGETIDHLLVSCVFSRQVWFNVLRNLALQVLEPHSGERSFEDWWASTSSRVSGQVQKGVSIPSSCCVPGPCGNTAIVVSLMASSLTLPMSSRL